MPGLIFGYSVWQNFDVPEVVLFRVKFHKIVNFSDLARHLLLKMHKSSGSSAVRTKMQKCWCWDTCKVLHFAQLQFGFFYNQTTFWAKLSLSFLGR